MKLRNFVFLFLIIVITLATTIVGYTFYNKYEELTINYFAKFLANNQQSIKSNIERFIEEKRNDIVLFSTRRIVTEQLRPQMALQELVKIRNTYRNYESLEITDMNGKTLIHTSQLNIGETSDASTLALKVRQEKTTQFDLQIDEQFQKGKINIAQPIFNKKGQLSYILIAHIPINRALEEFSKNTSSSEYINSNIELRTKNDKILFKSHLEKFAFENSFHHVDHSRKEPTLMKFGGDIYILSHFRVIPGNPHFDWLLISKISLDNIKAPFQELVKKIAFFGLLFLFALLVFSHYLLFKILQPFDSLSSSMEALSKGKFDKIPNTHSYIYEISNLITGFNLMIDNLKTSIAESAKNSKFAALGQMSSGIAHEINNPLTIIKGLTYIIPKMVETDNKQKIIDSTKKIEDTVDRIAKIIKSLRAYARDEAQEPLKKESVTTIIYSTLDLCSEKYKNMGIELQINLPSTDIYINARAFQISQILINLLNNASEEVLKYDDSRWIRISAKQSHLGKVEISVENSGPKIPSEIAAKLFVPFFTTKEPGKGTGLGLSISQGIAKTHNGDLKLDISGPYTKFILILPENQDTSALKAI